MKYNIYIYIDIVCLHRISLAHRNLRVVQHPSWQLVQGFIGANILSPIIGRRCSYHLMLISSFWLLIQFDDIFTSSNSRSIHYSLLNVDGVTPNHNLFAEIVVKSRCLRSDSENGLKGKLLGNILISHIFLLIKFPFFKIKFPSPILVSVVNSEQFRFYIEICLDF